MDFDIVSSVAMIRRTWLPRWSNARLLARLLALWPALLFCPIMAHAGEPLTVWHHEGHGKGENAIIEKLIADWNVGNPADPARLVLIPETAYSDLVQAAALKGTLPDLLDFDGPHYANYVWAGYLRPLNGLISEQILSNMLPSVLKQGTYAPDGKIYSLGQFDSGLALWASKSMLTKAGIPIPRTLADAWSLESFEAVLAKLRASGIATPLDLKLNYGKGEWFTYGFSPIVQSFGGDLINRKTWRASGTLDSPGSVAALRALQRWIKEGYVVPASAGDDAFEGKRIAAISLVGHWAFTQYRDALKDDLVLLPMPKFGTHAVTGMGSWCWGIPETSQQPQKAAKLLEFLLSDAAISETVAAVGGVPATKTSAEKAGLFADQGPLRLYLDQLNTIAVPRPSHPAYPIISGAFSQAVMEVIDGMDPQEALTKAALQIDQDIDDNQGYPPFSEQFQENHRP